MSMAEAIIVLCAGYMLAGGLFALAFVARGAARLDPAARGAGWAFSATIFPAAVALWPLLALKWLRVRRSSGAHS